MTKLKVATIGAVAVLGLGTPLLVQNQTIQGLRQERQIDQDRQARLLGEWQRLSNQLAQAREANAISSDQFAELLRLRNEVAGLRKLPGQLEALKGQNAQLQVQAEQASVRNQEPVEEFFPSRRWQDYGLSTPNASALTFLWASKEGNVPRYAAAMGKSSLEIDETGWRNELLEVADLKLTDQEPIGGEEVLVSLDYRLHSGTIEKGALALKRRDDEWVVSRIMGFPIRLTVSPVDE